VIATPYVRHRFDVLLDNKPIAKSVRYYDAKSMLVKAANQILADHLSKHSVAAILKSVGTIAIVQHDPDNYDIYLSVLGPKRLSSKVLHIRLSKHLLNKSWDISELAEVRIEKVGEEVVYEHADQDNYP